MHHAWFTLIYTHSASRQLSIQATAIVGIVQLRPIVLGNQASTFLLRACLHAHSATNLSAELPLKCASNMLSHTSVFSPSLSVIWSLDLEDHGLKYPDQVIRCHSRFGMLAETIIKNHHAVTRGYRLKNLISSSAFAPKECCSHPEWTRVPMYP